MIQTMRGCRLGVGKEIVKALKAKVFADRKLRYLAVGEGGRKM